MCNLSKKNFMSVCMKRKRAAVVLGSIPVSALWPLNRELRLPLPVKKFSFAWDIPKIQLQPGDTKALISSYKGKQ
jgi:hypothetical protein